MSVEGHRHDQYSQTDHGHTEAQVAGLTADLSLLVAGIANAAPTGTVSMFAGSAAPSYWLLCNGQAVSRTTYSALFTAIGTTYGAGDGSTTFNVPDMRGRVTVGVGTGTGLTARTLAGTGGAESVTLTAAQSGVPAHTHPTAETAHSHTGTSAAGAAHSHSVGDTGHTHGAATGAGAAHSHSIAHEHNIALGSGSGAVQRFTPPPSTYSSSTTFSGQTATTASTSGNESAHTHSISSGTTGVTVGNESTHTHTFTSNTTSTGLTVSANTTAAAGSSHENMQPFIALNFIIKV